MADWAPFTDTYSGGLDSKADDDEEQNATSNEGLERDILLFLVDCSKGMFERTPDGILPFHNAIKLASTAYQTKIIGSDRDLLGLCFYATKEKRNQFEFPGIYIFHDLDIPDAIRIKELEILLESPDFEECIGHHDGPFPLHEALWTAQHLFNHVPKGAAFKRIWLFTNDDDPTRGDQREYTKCMQRAKDLLDSDIIIELFAQCRPRTAPSSGVPSVVPGSVTGTSRPTSSNSPHHITPPSSSSHSSSLIPGSLSLHTHHTVTSGSVGPPAGPVSTSSMTGQHRLPTSSHESGSYSQTGSHRSPYGSQTPPPDSRYAPFNTGLFWNPMIYHGSEDLYTGCITFLTSDMEKNIGQLRLMRRSFHKRSAGKISVVLGPNSDGQGLEFAARLYNPVMRAKKAAHCWVNPDTNRLLTVETKTLCVDTGAELTEDDIDYHYMYGGERVVFSKEEVTRIKTQFGEPGLKILGFKPLSRMKPYHFVKHSSFLYPDEQAVKGSAKLFWALHESMLLQKKIAMGMIIPRQNASPSFVALEAQEEETSEEGAQVRPPGIVVIPLPYADDIRDLDIPATSAQEEELKLGVTKAKKLVNRLAISFDSNQFEDPVLQKHYACLHALALDKEQVEMKPDLTEPDLHGMCQHRSVIEAFRKAVYPEHYSPCLAEKGSSSRSLKDDPAKVQRLDISGIDFAARAAAGTLAACTLAELKEYCRQKALLVSGPKATLIQRIEMSLGIAVNAYAVKKEEDLSL